METMSTTLTNDSNNLNHLESLNQRKSSLNHDMKNLILAQSSILDGFDFLEANTPIHQI
jgi:hypothetical protein